MVKDNPTSAGCFGNRLLDMSLGKSRSNSVLKHLEPIKCDFGDILAEPGQRIRYVYFPTSGFISLVAKADDHSTLEVGLIGDEGMLGTSLILGINVSPLHALVQGEGMALRMKASDFKRELSVNARLERDLRRYLYLLLVELARASVCTRFHLVEARLSRWLLMTQDCAHADHFSLKHEFLAKMLGVRRSGITIAAGALQRKNLIHYNRGNITVLDRAGLERASCECYALISTMNKSLYS